MKSLLQCKNSIASKNSFDSLNLLWPLRCLSLDMMPYNNAILTLFKVVATLFFFLSIWQFISSNCTAYSSCLASNFFVKLRNYASLGWSHKRSTKADALSLSIRCTMLKGRGGGCQDVDIVPCEYYLIKTKFPPSDLMHPYIGTSCKTLFE